MADYAVLKCFINEAPSTQHTSLKKTTTSGDQPVQLLETGLAGFTPGGGEVVIEIGYAIPIGGPEFDFESMAAHREEVSMQFWQGAKNYSGVGRIMEGSVSQSTGANAEGTATWRGPLKPNDG
jgi:hypothetical protein